MIVIRQKEFIDWTKTGLNQEGNNKLAKIRQEKAIALNKYRNSVKDRAKLDKALEKAKSGAEGAKKGLLGGYAGTGKAPTVTFKNNIFHPGEQQKKKETKKTVARSNAPSNKNTKLGSAKPKQSTKAVPVKTNTPTPTPTQTPAPVVEEVAKTTTKKKPSNNFLKRTWKSGKLGKAAIIGTGLAGVAGMGYLGKKADDYYNY